MSQVAYWVSSNARWVLVLPCHELRLLLSLSVKEGLVVLPSTVFHTRSRFQLLFVGSWTARLCRSSPEANSEPHDHENLQLASPLCRYSCYCVEAMPHAASRPLARALEAALDSSAFPMSRRTAQSYPCYPDSVNVPKRLA